MHDSQTDKQIADPMLDDLHVRSRRKYDITSMAEKLSKHPRRLIVTIEPCHCEFQVTYTSDRDNAVALKSEV